MINIKKISIVALILLLVGIAGSAFFLQGMKKDDWVEEERTVNDEFQTIEITTDNTQIELLPTSELAAKVELTGNDSNHVLTTEVKDNTLSIQVNYNQKKYFNFNFFDESLSLKVYVPEKQYEALQIRSNNGRITVDNIHAKDTKIKSDNGRLVISNVEGTTVTTETNNGSTSLKRVKSTTISVKSNNGKIELIDIEGEIIGNTNNGGISLATSHLDRSIQLKTDNGRITIDTEKEPTNATINVDVKNGRVDIFGSSSNHKVIGDGEHAIKLTTKNGSVTVK
ncbi:DUF4097 family beta strand repeat-containing protein [Sutcliffiella halmapala]|uniref:DUF4097 family beta strand repeat-containing protein n=1 Tax=Sutcliffiella halmapala TaxID=79882 RepID=UPI000994D6BB|nr:DUF4097 family beta strand repeat-containing protein [Sutcliffiella halmapala]